MVEKYAAVGLPIKGIGTLVGLSIPKVMEYYRKELDIGMAKANVAIGGALYKSAVEGNVTAQIFWMKTRAGWRETDRLELTGADGGPIQGGVVLIPQKFETMEEWVEFAKKSGKMVDAEPSKTPMLDEDGGDSGEDGHGEDP